MLVDPLTNEPLQFLSLHWAEARKEEQTHLNILMRPHYFKFVQQMFVFIGHEFT